MYNMYSHSLTWTRARRYIVSAAATNTERVCALPCSDIIIKLIIHTAAAAVAGRARVLRLALSQKRGRDGHCTTRARARTAGGSHRLLSTRT